MKFELDSDYLYRCGFPIGWEDLRLGLALGLVSPRSVVEFASLVVSGGAHDSVLEELAGFQMDDARAVYAVLQVDIDGEVELVPAQSVRKWVYLQLKAAFEMRNRLRDPLGVVEQIYADFDYPEDVAEFVRYMPTSLGEETGESVLFDKWARYLTREAEAL